MTIFTSKMRHHMLEGEEEQMFFDWHGHMLIALTCCRETLAGHCNVGKMMELGGCTASQAGRLAIGIGL